MSSETPLSERPWRCPRCKFHRCYVTVESGLSSTVQYEVMICDNCAHVEMRAADLDVVATLAAGGLHGVRLVKFLPESHPASGQGDIEAPLVEPELATVARPETTAAVKPDPEIPPPTLRDFPPPSPISVRESLDQTAPLLQVKLRSSRETPPVDGSGCMLTIFLILGGLGAAAWLLFGRTEAPDTRAPAPNIAASAAPSVPISDLPGAPHAVDPGAVLEQARRVSGLGSKAVLSQIEGVFVGSNGKVDLDNPHYKGRIIYRFDGKTDAPEPLPRPEGVPLGAPGSSASLLGTHFRRTVMVNAERIGLIESYDWPEKQAQVLPQEVPPRCSFRQIWDAARTGDAPADAVATVKYTINGDAPSWWFQIENTSFGFSINPATCTRY